MPYWIFHCVFITFRFGKISFPFVSFRFVSFRFVSFRFVLFCSVSCRFVWYRFVSFRSISFRFVWFRFVSFGFVSFRFISLRFYFLSHFTGTRKKTYWFDKGRKLLLKLILVKEFKFILYKATSEFLLSYLHSANLEYVDVIWNNTTLF